MNSKKLIEDIYKEAIRARNIVSRYARRTPIDHSTTFSKIARGTVYLKYENLQRTGSFKIRGALYKIYKLSGKVKGVVAASAGNHAQGVAFASSALSIPSIIVMPETASISKIEATRNYGAKVILHGKIYDEAEIKAREIAREKNYYLVHPFDDIDVIAGQATIAFEILEEINDIDAILVPVGGGGLISGIATVAKKIKPSIKIIGVEPENAPKTYYSLKVGRPVEVEVKPTIADGLATKKLGDITFTVIKDLVDEIVLVSEEDLAHAIYLLLERGKILAEGAGAAPIAALLSSTFDLKGKSIVALISGGNIDLTALYRLVLRGLTAYGRIVTIQGYVYDVPGTLAEITSIIAQYRGNILDVLHDRIAIDAPAWHTSLKIVFEVPSQEASKAIIEELQKRGYKFKIT